MDGVSLRRQGGLDEQVDVKIRVAAMLVNSAEANSFVGLKDVLRTGFPEDTLEPYHCCSGGHERPVCNGTHSSTYVAIAVMFNLRQVAITRQAISPLLVINKRRTRGCLLSSSKIGAMKRLKVVSALMIAYYSIGTISAL